jgi:hypothetical protein
MKKKPKPKLMLHMHQLRDFIDDRYSFYEKYFFNVEPKHYQFKGVKKAFLVGGAIDFGIKQYYLNIQNGQVPGENILASDEFNNLPNKIDQTICMSLLDAYITVYHDNADTKEYFHSFEARDFVIPFRFNNINRRKLKYEYVLYLRPDLLAKTFLDNDLVVIEIKTTADSETQYSAETLDFQTMTYCWGSYRWNFKIPKYVIKRTLFKPKIKQKKNETISEFQKRIVIDMVDKPEKYIKSTVRPVNKGMILEFEKYLTEIICDLDAGLKTKSKYKFWKKSSDYWGNNDASLLS